MSEEKKPKDEIVFAPGGLERRPTWRGAFETAADRLEESYSPEAFPPLSESELERARNALNELDPNGAARFIAHWSRHCAARLRGFAAEEAPE